MKKTHQKPLLGIPINWTKVITNWKKKIKKKTIKLNDESLRNALYAGLNQHKNENGVNIKP